MPSKSKDLIFSKLYRNVVPDGLDLRDRPYVPPVSIVPAAILAPDPHIPVLNQKYTNACTGFALASVVFHLQRRANRPKAQLAVSPYMLYDMAKRYDEFPGDPNADTGSSLRGAMKGWYKHGVCAWNLWKTPETPPPAKDPRKDYWLDAARRPLGAYFRVNPKAVTDMHVALTEVGAIYASAVCHEGWGELRQSAKSEGYCVIPKKRATPKDGAHAFAILGYTSEGFIIHNSWDTGWGTRGRAILTYDGWVENARDCWVAQLGVVTETHEKVAQSKTLAKPNQSVRLATNIELRNKQLDPYVIDMENNGRLSNTGEFRTKPEDINWLVTQQLGDARKLWGLNPSDPVDIAVYAHGGLTSEKSAANTAATWVKALYDAQIFPIFLMWETDLWSTLKDIGEDVIAKQRATGAILDRVETWWNQRLEKMLSVPGTRVWGEMKKNADAISSSDDAGGILLYEACTNSPWIKDPRKVRLHLIGHSAGAIVHSAIIRRLGDRGWNFQTVNFMAPAVRVDTFLDQVVPAIRSGKVNRYNQFSLTDDIEQKDPTCEPIFGYSRSLLYLVSQSFEKGQVTPILGMERYAGGVLNGLKNAALITAPGVDSRSTTHGGFDDDAITRDKIISLIKQY